MSPGRRTSPSRRRPPRQRPAADAGGAFARGQEALARCDWTSARDLFLDAVSRSPTPEALEGLGWACSHLGDAGRVFEAREQASRAYLERGDRRGAARVAIWLAFDYAELRGDRAVADGLLQRAREWLDGLDVSAEHAWLAGIHAHGTLLGEKDPVKAEALASDARRLAEQAGCRDVVVLAQAIEGLSAVTRGDIAEGMRRLDAAVTAALGGEVQDISAVGPICCYLIFACERVRDYDRASQWCERLKELTERWNTGSLLGTCRMQYAGVLMCRGDWPTAEAELIAGRDLLSRIRPALARGALPRLAELRRRQGRWDDALELFRQVDHTPLGQLGMGELAFDQGDHALAADLAERFLRRFRPEDRLERVPGLELLARARLALNDVGAAQVLVREIEEIADRVATPPLRAAAAVARGLVEAALGQSGEARRWFEDAVDLFTRSGCPFEAGRARLELARAYDALGRPAPARGEALAARQAFADLGAAREAARAEAFLEARSSTSGRNAPDIGGRSAALTDRELDVLRLVAGGLGDREIAARLSISPHTVHRHVSNILTKLDLPSRAAAVAWAARQSLV